MKAASQGGVPWGSSRSSGPDILDAVLLPDALAGFGGHWPALFRDPERDLLEVLLASPLTIPSAEDLGAVPASTEAVADHLDLALLRLEAPEVRPDVALAV